jgi:F-type H+-transporting ATPase subunit epsilon
MSAPASTAEGGTSTALRVSVITPEATIFEGEATQVVAPAWNGSLGVRPGHAPLMALLGTGTLRIDSGGSSKSYAVSGGFLQVVDNTVTVLSESATAA